MRRRHITTNSAVTEEEASALPFIFERDELQASEWVMSARDYASMHLSLRAIYGPAFGPADAPITVDRMHGTGR